MKRKLIRTLLAAALCLLLTVPAFATGSGSGAQLFNPTALIICLIIGFVLALIPMGVLRSQINNVHSKTEATNYTRGNLDLQGREDTFLYRNVTRVPIPRNNNNNNGH